MGLGSRGQIGPGSGTLISSIPVDPGSGMNWDGRFGSRKAKVATKKERKYFWFSRTRCSIRKAEGTSIMKVSEEITPFSTKKNFNVIFKIFYHKKLASEWLQGRSHKSKLLNTIQWDHIREVLTRILILRPVDWITTFALFLGGFPDANNKHFLAYFIL